MNDVTQFITYRRADGKPVYGEYSFVTEYVGMDDEESDVIEEVWILQSRRVIPRRDPWDEFDDDNLYEDEDERVKKFREV